MLIIVGTYPDLNCPLLAGKYELKANKLEIKGHLLDINRGTTALAATGKVVADYLGLESPYLIIAGDIGRGEGTFQVYTYLEQELKHLQPEILTFHYLLPDVDWQYRLIWQINKLGRKPFLIADAGHMYAVKMSGLASEYDLFTPDIGELAFLADEKAPHPFYTRGFILHQEEETETLITRSYQKKNASRFLLVKGKADLIVEEGLIKKRVEEPVVKSLEAIGGTGDTLTGLISTLFYAQKEPLLAMTQAAKINRQAGLQSNPTPATQIVDIIKNFPKVLDTID